MRESVTCRSCDAAIFWAVTERGRRIPIDVEPVANGNITLSDFSDGLRATYLRKDETTRHDRYVSHFATCPDAKTHRRKP